MVTLLLPSLLSLLFFCPLVSLSSRPYPDKCTREHAVLPTAQDHPEVKNAQISTRRLQKQLPEAWQQAAVS